MAGVARKKLTRRDEHRVAVQADVDLRSVQRYLRGGAMRLRTAERIEDALRTLGFDAAVRGAA